MESQAKYELTQADRGNGLNAWIAMKEQASMLVKSGFLPVSINSPEKAVAVALAAKEIGIGMMEGFRSINIIQGKPTISPQLMLALARRTKELEDMKIDANNERAIVTIKRKGESPHTEEFGIKEATALGLYQRDNYKKQAATMFKWRALAANLRVTFPDTILGLYTPEELGADVKIGDNEEMVVVHNGNDAQMPEEQPEIAQIEAKPLEVKDMPNFIPNGSNSLFKKITDKQRKRLYAIWKGAGLTDDIVQQHLIDEYGIMNTADITMDKYEEICEWCVESGKRKQ